MAEPAHVIAAHEKYAHPLGFSRDGERLVTGGFDGSLAVWSTEDWSAVARSPGHEQSVNCGAITAPGRLVTGSTDTTVRTWELPSLEAVSVLEGHANTVAGLASHPTEPLAATASYDASVRVWDTANQTEALVLEGHPRNVTTVAFVGGSDHLASGGLGDAVFVWSLEAAGPVEQLPGHGAAVAGIAAGVDDQLWSVGHNGTLLHWSTDDWQERGAFDLPIEGGPTGLAAHPSEPRLAVSHDGGTTVVSPQGERLDRHDAPIKGIYSPRWTHDGRYLAVGGADGEVRLYE